MSFEEEKSQIVFTGYPEYVVDSVDKILYDILIREDNLTSDWKKKNGYTFSQLSREVLTRLIRQASNGLTLQDKITKWVESGYLEEKSKQTQIVVYKKTEGDLDG